MLTSSQRVHSGALAEMGPSLLPSGWSLLAILFILQICAASSPCYFLGSCNGHGDCDATTYTCICYEGWGASTDIAIFKAPDCSQRRICCYYRRVASYSPVVAPHFQYCRWGLLLAEWRPHTRLSAAAYCVHFMWPSYRIYDRMRGFVASHCFERRC